MKHEEYFQISIELHTGSSAATILISHTDETFNFELEGQHISIINNGDNSWSLVEGDLEQETVNLIGSGIEQHYQSQNA